MAILRTANDVVERARIKCKGCSAITLRMMCDLRVWGLVFTVGLRMDNEHTAITEPVRWLEVFPGAGRRRTWRDEDKARIVAEIGLGPQTQPTIWSALQRREFPSLSSQPIAALRT